MNEELEPIMPMGRLLDAILESERPDDLAVGWLRYRIIRDLSHEAPGQLVELLSGGKTVDDIVMDAISSWLQKESASVPLAGIDQPD